MYENLLFVEYKLGKIILCEKYLKKQKKSFLFKKAGHTALHITGSNGELEIAKVLLRNGADVHKLSKANKSALHLACQNGHLALAELLLGYGSNVDGKDIFEMTPLHWFIVN